MMGDMSRIEAWADMLEERNKAYRSFADKLRELAGGFKTKAILAMVEHAMGEGNGP